MVTRRMAFVSVAVVLLCGSCCDEPATAPEDRPEVFVIGHSAAVAEAVRYLESEGYAAREDTPPDSATLVLFAVNVLDGVMPATNVPLADVSPRAPDQAAILLVYSALGTDPEIRELVLMETVDYLVDAGQANAPQFLQILDDEGGIETVASFFGDAAP
jgi:hypothetical protein